MTSSPSPPSRFRHRGATGKQVQVLVPGEGANLSLSRSVRISLVEHERLEQGLPTKSQLAVMSLNNRPRGPEKSWASNR